MRASAQGIARDGVGMPRMRPRNKHTRNVMCILFDDSVSVLHRYRLLINSIIRR